MQVSLYMPCLSFLFPCCGNSNVFPLPQLTPPICSLDWHFSVLCLYLWGSWLLAHACPNQGYWKGSCAASGWKKPCQHSNTAVSQHQAFHLITATQLSLPLKLVLEIWSRKTGSGFCGWVVDCWQDNHPPWLLSNNLPPVILCNASVCVKYLSSHKSRKKIQY